MEVYGLNYLKIKQAIGKPYELEASSTPDSFNCWSLITFLYPHAPSYNPTQLKEYIELFNSKSEEMLTDVWVEVENPREGDITLFAKNEYYSHAGIFLGANKILHASKVGVVIESLDMLNLHYKNKRFYRWQ